MISLRRILFIIAVISLFHQPAISQDIVNFITLGSNGITNNPDEVISFIVIKKYEDGHYERLDYKKGGPLMKLSSYKDDSLKVLNGRFMQYEPNGNIKFYGAYSEGLKSGDWLTFGDSYKVVLSVKFDHDTIVKVNDLDSKDSTIYEDSKEAEYPGGIKAWSKYVSNSIVKSGVIDRSFGGGQTKVNFTINTDGAPMEIFLSKSSEFILDEECIRIIKVSHWKPAFANGKNVKSYMMQPFTFEK